VNTNDGIVITQAIEGNPIIYINESFTKMTGYTLQELEGKNPRVLQGLLSDKNENLRIRKAIKNFEPCEINTINYKKNGEIFWANVIIKPIANEKGIFTHWIAISRDFTEFKKMSESLEYQKNFYDEILNNIPTDIAVFAPNHNYIFVNPYAVRNNEIRKWLINKNDLDYTKMKGIDDTMALKRWEYFDNAVSNQSTVQWIDEHKTADGKSNFVLRNLYPYFQNDELKFVIGYGIDITERKLAENRLIEALESLRKTNLELEQFAYVASHDLQEPLRMVSSFLTQLEKKYGDQLDNKAKEYIFYAVDGAKRMRQIILDLLAYSRAGKEEEIKSNVDLNEILTEIKILYAQRITETKTLIHSEELPVIFANRTPIRQVFQNLISNAIKYSRVAVSPVIEIQCAQKATYWEIIFKDNGIGIEPEYHEKIFVIFQRLHNKNEYEGSGIGLAITKKINESIGGKIWVTSNENHGSAFHITIPFLT
jgi:PAS domain S-box-containing protein